MMSRFEEVIIMAKSSFIGTEVAAGKYLQALRALNVARGIDASSPELHVRIVDFKSRSESSFSTKGIHVLIWLVYSSIFTLRATIL